ncbi:MAG: type IX secretion system membrane protein PorP/SprF [Ferruginibacter sp.]|nr:type IX secretion system membrane protein PorP/SprF [Ferruginibacter sp.]
MKIFFLFSLGIMILCCANAQQKPHYTQYVMNQYILNPALTGIENYTDIKISHRHQWVGIQDAPVTTYFTIHGPIGKKDLKTTATSFEVAGENPRGKNYWQEYTASEPHHGIGMQIINDRTGPLNRFSAYATYAYHIGLTPRTSLSAGFAAGISNISLNASKLVFNASTPVDPAVYGTGILNRVRPDINAGLYLYSSDYFVGVSVQQVVPQKIKFSEGVVTTEDGKLVPHFFVTAGYRLSMGDDFNLLPSVMLKYIDPVPMQVDLNAKLQYRDLFWFGTGYRFKDGFSGMAGLNISNTMNIGYSYDYNTSKINNFSRGTHEILVGFILGNKYGDTCPRNVW